MPLNEDKWKGGSGGTEGAGVFSSLPTLNSPARLGPENATNRRGGKRKKEKGMGKKKKNRQQTGSLGWPRPSPGSRKSACHPQLTDVLADGGMLTRPWCRGMSGIPASVRSEAPAGPAGTCLHSSPHVQPSEAWTRRGVWVWGPLCHSPAA